MTLHDLESGAPSPELEAGIGAIEGSARALRGRIAAAGVNVRLRSTGVYCMAATSPVLGLEPAGYTGDQLAALRDAVEAGRGMDGLSFEVPISAAEYMRFSDMAVWWRE